ncbi:hypothetical protein T440DRAFT_397199, partial [Plenodomus tracheiphilus IPT5]
GVRLSGLRPPITQETLNTRQPPGELRFDRSQPALLPVAVSPIGCSADVLALQSHVGHLNRWEDDDHHNGLSIPTHATAPPHKLHLLQDITVIWSILPSIHDLTYLTQSRLTHREPILRCHYTASSRSLKESLQGSSLTQTFQVTNATGENERGEARSRGNGQECE